MSWVRKRTIGGVGERRGGGERGPEHHRSEKMMRRGHFRPPRAPQFRAGSSEAPSRIEQYENELDKGVLRTVATQHRMFLKLQEIRARGGRNPSPKSAPIPAR